MFPAFFMAHGAPSLVMEHNPYTRFLRSLGLQLPRPNGVVLFSPYWDSPVQLITGAAQLETVHDFFGYSQELYQVVYPAKGDMVLSLEIQTLLAEEGISCRIDDRQGLDHGAWSLLSLLFPHADVPVVELSVNPRLVPEEQYRIGRALMRLREQQCLIVGSGGIVFNPQKLKWNERDDEHWSVSFDRWLEERIHMWDLDALFDYENRAAHAGDSAPSNTHLMPLFISMGAADRNRNASLLHQQYQLGSLSLSCWMFS